uniref:Uncharacterized protein n=1 Tax=Myoviridae sp. ctWiL39 TaxID=2825120 RepID=A0A8S5PWX2_9CAUD|nr:MAG TPA: hypothetical protein [Myoviridae sp. ctWiL39]
MTTSRRKRRDFPFNFFKIFLLTLLQSTQKYGNMYT